MLLAILGYAASQLFDTLPAPSASARLRWRPTAPDRRARRRGRPVRGRPPATRSSPWPGSSLFLGASSPGVNWVALALLALPRRRRARSSCARACCSASTGRCASSASRPSSSRARCSPGCSGWPGWSSSRPGGSDSTLTLSFLDLARAEALREHLLVLAGRTDEVTPERGRAAGPERHRAAAAGCRAPPGALRRPATAGAGPSCSRCPTAGSSSRRSSTGRRIVLALVVVRAARGRGPQRRPAGAGRLPALVPAALRHRDQPGQGAARPRQLPARRHRHRGPGPGGPHRPADHDDPDPPRPGRRARAAAVVAALRLVADPGQRRRRRVAGGEGEGQHETVVLPVGTSRTPWPCSPWSPRVPRRLVRRRLGDGHGHRLARSDPAPPGGSTRSRGAATPGASASAVLLRSGRFDPPRRRRAPRADPVGHPAPGLARAPARSRLRPRRPRADRSPRSWPTSTSRTPRRSWPRWAERARSRAAGRNPARPSCTRPSGVGGLVPAPAATPERERP